MDVGISMDEFLVDDFDAEGFSRRLLSTSRPVAEQVSILASSAAQLDKQLRNQISTHHEKLLDRATGIESLEGILTEIGQHTAALKATSDGAVGRTMQLFDKTATQTNQLRNMHDTCNLLRALMRVVNLSAKLRHDSAAAPSGQQMLRRSAALQELGEILDENDLSGVDAVADDVRRVPTLKRELIALCRESLLRALAVHDLASAGNALQVFCNLHCLTGQLSDVLDGMVGRLGDHLKALDERATGAAPTARSDAPGGAAIPPPPASSAAVRANLWTNVHSLADTLLSTVSTLDDLQLVLSRKRSSAATLSLLDDVKWFDEMLPTLWLRVAQMITSTLAELPGLPRQIFENEFPKLLRYFGDVIDKLKRAPAGSCPVAVTVRADAAAELRRALVSSQNAYLSKSLSRLFDCVNLGFNEEQPPSSVEVDNILKVMASEIQAACFDEALLGQILRNVAKTVKLYSVKAEQQLSTDAEASQVIGRQNAGQKRNVAIVNALAGGRNGVLRLCAEVHTADTSAVAETRVAADQLLAVMEAAVQPLVSSIDDAISAILDTMHDEDFSFELPEQTAPAEHQCSLYMRELQGFVTRVWLEHLAPFACRDFIYERSGSVARKAARLFTAHATLIRPLGEGGRLRLAADFAQMELALSPLCARVAETLGAEYDAMRALRPLLFVGADVLAASADVGTRLPYWLVMQLLISSSADELPSPHTSAGWSVARYVEWLEEHPADADRLQFLRGTLEAYAISVQVQDKTEYVSTYPLLLDLLKTALRSQ